MKLRKYRNIPTEIDGIRFDSRKEAKRYREKYILNEAQRQEARERVAAWRLANPERVRENNRRAYEKNKAKYKACAKKWAEENPERREAIVLQSRAARADHKRKANREYVARLKIENPEKLREKGRRSMAIRRGSGHISPEWWQGLVELFDAGNCVYCGGHAGSLVVDHFHPVSRGGRTKMGNLLLCCAPCNRAKSDKLPEIWVREKCGQRGYEEIVRALAVIGTFKDEASQRLA